MRRFCRPRLPFKIALGTCFVALATACAVYEDGPPEPRSDGGGAAGTGGGGATGGAAGRGGSTGGGGGTGGTAEEDGGELNDASLDADVPLPDVALPPDDARTDRTNDVAETGSPGDAGLTDTWGPPDADDLDARDTSVPDANDAPRSDGSNDVASDEPRAPDADAAPRPDADAGPRDVVDGGPIAPQTLPLHGTPIQKPDAGGPFESRCASDEVVTGFVGRAGVQTDAIGSTCSNLIGGVLSSPRNLPLHGFATGGNAFTVTCPANYAAVGIVGRYGHNTMWKEDVTTMIGVVCKALGSTATQIVTITGQPALDPGYSSFREDCTGGRFLTVISGRTDSNSLGFTVQQVGGECNAR
jgi:hypothetical protein